MKGIFYLICLILLVSSCEKLVNYKYEADQKIEFSKISGRVVNKFTGQPVDSARIGFEDQYTLTDEPGFYSINYILGLDETRDRPVYITAAAPNYFPFKDSLIIFPTETEYNFSMDYAAPIIRQFAVAVSGSGADMEPVFQAEIVDYQGKSNIASVYLELQFLSNSSPDTRWVKFEMVYIAESGPASYYYQLIINPDIRGGFFFGDKSDYKLFVADKDGYSASLLGKYFVPPDPFIFPPN